METYFKNLTAEDGTKERLIQDLRILMHDAEDLIAAAGKHLPEKSKEQLMVALERFKTTCQRMEREAVSAARSADRMIREHPYESIGVAFGVGVLIGVLLHRD
jgi:ElaB/YqjD/DUF883 family membrane-anchored ribosome-binding protein